MLKVSKKTNNIKIMGETESIQKGGGEMAWKTVLKYPEEGKRVVKSGWWGWLWLEIVLNVSVCGVEHSISTNVNPVLSDILQDTRVRI